MRTGQNPQKNEKPIQLLTNHRVILVVFIPQIDGYYKNMFDVVQLCLSSLIKSLPATSAITVVDNGSCETVQTYLNKLFCNKEIDCLKLYSSNIGKIDALIGEARASREPLITLSDCDILFCEDWVQETINIFNAFKGVGSVAPFPNRYSFQYDTYSIQEKLIYNKINFSLQLLPENWKYHNHFLKSINWDEEENPEKLWPLIENEGICAIIGSSHQVLTMRRDILFSTVPFTPSFIKVGKNSEREYVDDPIDQSGMMRLSTKHFFAHHIGNQIEPWMEEILTDSKQKEESIHLKLIPPLKYRKSRFITYRIKKRLLKKIIPFIIPRGWH